MDQVVVLNLPKASFEQRVSEMKTALRAIGLDGLDEAAFVVAALEREAQASGMNANAFLALVVELQQLLSGKTQTLVRNDQNSRSGLFEGMGTNQQELA